MHRHDEDVVEDVEELIGDGGLDIAEGVDRDFLAAGIIAVAVVRLLLRLGCGR